MRGKPPFCLVYKINIQDMKGNKNIPRIGKNSNSKFAEPLFHGAAGQEMMEGAKSKSRSSIAIKFSSQQMNCLQRVINPVPCKYM